MSGDGFSVSGVQGPAAAVRSADRGALGAECGTRVLLVPRREGPGAACLRRHDSARRCQPRGPGTSPSSPERKQVPLKGSWPLSQTWTEGSDSPASWSVRFLPDSKFGVACLSCTRQCATSVLYCQVRSFCTQRLSGHWSVRSSGVATGKTGPDCPPVLPRTTKKNNERPEGKELFCNPFL